MVQIRTFPTDDHEFREVVDRALDAVGLRRSDVKPNDLDQVLRDALDDVRMSYPRARMALQSELGTTPGDERTVYAYRDGHPVPVES